MNRNQVPGTVFGTRDWPQGKPVIYVFVPNSYLDFNEEEGRDPATIDFSTFDEETSRISRWTKLNALANNLDGNLLLLPDLDISPHHDCKQQRRKHHWNTESSATAYALKIRILFMRRGRDAEVLRIIG